MQDFVNFANFIGGTPLHVILFVSVYTLWRRILHLEAKLEDCLTETRTLKARKD